MSTESLFNSSTREERWWEHNTLGCASSGPIVFQVPQSLRDTKPQVYTPQKVGLGPYYHLRLAVQGMYDEKREKVQAFTCNDEEAEYFANHVNGLSLKLGSKTKEKSPAILSFYDTHVDLDDKTLARIIVVDGIFLLKFLEEESKSNDNSDQGEEKEDRKDHHKFVADIMMLENQIPLDLLKEINKAVVSNRGTFTKATDIDLPNEFYHFCCKHSPLNLSDREIVKNVAFEKHLLHFLYHLTVNNYVDEESKDEETEESEDNENRAPSAICQLSIDDLRSAISKVGDFAKQAVETVLYVIDQAKSLDLQIPSEIAKLSKLLQQWKRTSELNHGSDKHHQRRLADKIDVPSVSQLHRLAKIGFCKHGGGIGNLSFDESKNIIYLPEIRVNKTSEVLLRNLVAYEEALKPGPVLNLAEHVDFMCGIIHTEMDVKLLKEFNIIDKSNSQPDEEIFRIFSAINKSTQGPHEESIVQEVVQKLNKKFNSLRIVKAYNSINKFFAILASWINRLFPIFVLVLLGLQTYCETYGCSSRRLGYAAAPAASSLGLDSEATLKMPRKVLAYDHTLV